MFLWGGILNKNWDLSTEKQDSNCGYSVAKKENM